MKKMNTRETRTVNGGGAYCKVCGYGSDFYCSDWKIMGHIAANHPAAVLKNMAYLIGKVF